MGGIYEVGRWNGLRHHGIHIKFHKNLFIHSQVDMGDTQTAWWSHKPAFIFQNKDSTLIMASRRIIRQPICVIIRMVVGFGLLTAVTENTDFWRVTLCSQGVARRSFGGTYCPHLQGRIEICLFLAGFLLVLLFDNEDGNNMVLRNFHGFPLDYTALHLRRQSSACNYIQNRIRNVFYVTSSIPEVIFTGDLFSNLKFISSDHVRKVCY
jgi:hypothetical protein